MGEEHNFSAVVSMGPAFKGVSGEKPSFEAILEQLEKQVDPAVNYDAALTQRVEALLEKMSGSCLTELAWGLIANAYGGNWDLASEASGWKAAAEKWRDDYFKTLSKCSDVDVEVDADGNPNP